MQAVAEWLEADPKEKLAPPGKRWHLAGRASQNTTLTAAPMTKARHVAGRLEGFAW